MTKTYCDYKGCEEEGAERIQINSVELFGDIEPITITDRRCPHGIGAIVDLCPTHRAELKKMLKEFGFRE